ncbi:hypothetical protein [Paenibacillus sp. P32E]|uniref:hypothetical protein n=1 Tax=Paenibacillus sp. P32E TaxID=1349434 RepID=UPI00273EC349|nr:hypothetical protein [Paenibacillus sp. P32E]
MIIINFTGKSTNEYVKIKISAGLDTNLLNIQTKKGVQAHMARTKTQKALLRAERSGTWCAERNRRQNDQYGVISQHVRVTPSKQQKLNKVKHKERIFQDGAPFHVWRIKLNSPSLGCKP